MVAIGGCEVQWHMSRECWRNVFLSEAFDRLCARRELFGGVMQGIRKGLMLVMLLIAMLCGLQAEAFGQVTTTTIQDTVYEASGSPASGTVVVTWPTFTTANGSAVAAGTTSATLGAGGALTIALAPNANATPTGTYYTAALHLGDGTTSTEYWVVPVSTSPVTLAAIESQVLPTSVAMQTVSKAYVQAAIAQAVGSGTGSSGTGSTEYVPISGGTMTGPLVLPADPVTPNQAADKHYVDTNVTALTGGMAQKVSMLPTVSQAVAQPLGTQLGVNVLNGELYASQFQTGDGGNGIANSLTSTACTTGCWVVIDPSYGSEPILTSEIQQTGRVVDLRGGGDAETTIDPYNGYNSTEVLNQLSTRSDANWANAGAGSDHVTLNLLQEGMAGGSNQLPGNVENPPYGKTTYGIMVESGSYYTEGQHVQNTNALNCFGVGDCLAGSQYITSYGGYRDMADEGTHPFDLQVNEGGSVFQGTCSSGCTAGSTSLMVNATSGPGTQGEGRFLIDKNPANVLTTGSIVGSSRDLFGLVEFSGTNFPVSVFLKTAAAATSQAHNIAPGTVTLPIATSGLPSEFATTTSALAAQTGVACVADPVVNGASEYPNFEIANYTVTDATHISLTLNKVHESGSVITVGGLCGYGLEQTIDTVNGIRQLFPVVGSVSATSLYYADALTPVVGNNGAASTSGFQDTSVAISSISRAGNVVSVTLASNLPIDINGVTATISGVADATYNGSFVVTTTAANTLTYPNTGANSTSSGGTLRLWTGGFALYPMAEVLSVYDPSTKQVDGALTLGANSVAWAAGDAVEEPHYYQQSTFADTEFISQVVPRPIQYASAGKQYGGEVGPGVRGWVIANSVPSSNYLGAGGTHEPPDDAYMANGVWNTDFEVDAGALSLIRAHCNWHGCNRWDSGYSLFALDSATGEDLLFYNPATDSVQWSLHGQTYTFSPSGFSTSAPLTSGSVNTGTNGSVTTGSISTSGTSLSMTQTGDVYGATSLSLENRNGTNGALFKNSGIELVDFAFQDSASFQSNIRAASNSFTNGYNNAKGEMDFLVNTTNQGGAQAVSTLYLGANSGQFYPGGHGQISINVAAATNPNAALAVNGSVSVGSYAGTTAAPANGLIVSGSVGIGSPSPAGLLSVGATNQFQVDGSGDVTVRQIVGSGASPTVSAAPAAGSGASATVTGTAVSGVLSVTAGTGPSASAALLNVAWTLGSSTPPEGCSLMPRNAAAAAVAATIYTGAPSTSGWTVNVGATALSASTLYSWSYQCM
jgi:trimeric autotransporter adhesin